MRLGLDPASKFDGLAVGTAVRLQTEVMVELHEDAANEVPTEPLAFL